MIKIVTDSVSDIPPEVAKELDITVVPAIVHFQNESYRDRIDLSAEAFYQKLEKSTVLPKTSAPSPSTFAEVFDTLATKANGIIGIFISRSFSAICDSALQGVALMKNKCPVEVVDSKMAIMMEGMLAIEAAKKAMEGASMAEILSHIEKTLPKIHMRSTIYTFKYLLMGGRIGKIQAWMATKLQVVPINTIKDGQASNVTRVRTREKAMEWLYEYITGFKSVKALAIEYGTNIDEAKSLARRIADLYPRLTIYLSQISPVIATHAGPGMLAVTVLEE